MTKSNGLAYAMVVAWDTAMTLQATRGKREQRLRDEFLERRMRAEGNRTDLHIMPYGGKAQTEDGKLLEASRKATIQKSRIKYTTKGDFTHLHSGHNELR